MASRRSRSEGSGSPMVPAVLRSVAGFGLAHLLFGGNRMLWTVLALVAGVVVGAAGFWLIPACHTRVVSPVCGG